jgi:hypothetical protein
MIGAFLNSMKMNLRTSFGSRMGHRWNGNVDPVDLIFGPWAARFPDLTPCDYFLWGYLKDKVFVPALPGSIPA